MRVFHVQRRPTADSNTPMFCIPAASSALRSIARGQHPDYELAHAADLLCDDLELAFMLTNNIEAPWADTPHPLVRATGLSKRSTSVNDILVHDNVVKVVRSIGFARLDIAADDLVFATTPYQTATT